MNYIFQTTHSSYKHIAGKTFPQNHLEDISLCKNEEFGFQLLILAKDKFLLQKDERLDIAWCGLIDKIRVEIVARHQGEDISKYFFVHLMDFVQDDNGDWILDIITNKISILSERKEQGIYIGGKLPKDFPYSDADLQIHIYHSQGYDDENLIFEQQIALQIHDYVLEDISESNFYMDLWQHPCNWARAYDLSYYSDEHFALIEKYFAALSQIGQRVCDLIISDFSWAGQRCYKVLQNHNNLFETNIISIYRDKDGEFFCDFSAFNRYIALAEKYRMADEINLFGILGNWDAKDFGNPLVDYKDPIRISYKDLSDGKYKYMSRKEEIRAYLNLVFSHLQDSGLWEKTLIMSDEPSNLQIFEEALALFEEAANGKNIRLKCAIHDQNFFESYSQHIQSLSLNTCELVHNIDKIIALRAQIEAKGGKLTWYSCCFPSDMNIFLKSPLIESRLVGWFTSYLNLHGFLRWAYGIWPKNVFESASYKPEKWAAGDMFFVYPGKDGAPLPSLRLKNLIFGIQDYILLGDFEEMHGRENLEQKLAALLGKKSDMEFIPEREIKLQHQLDWEGYEQFKQEIFSTMKNPRLQKISDAIVNMDEENIIPLIEDALANNISATDIYTKGLSDGMLAVTKLFDDRKYFVSEVIVCADTLNKGVKYLHQKAPIHSGKGPKVILGVVEGDLHEIGKNVVKIMFEASGFDVIDMGLNVKAKDIVQKAIEENADIIGLSTMMTTTMTNMQETIMLLQKENKKAKVIIGGGCISQKYANEIGADGYSANAVEAVRLVKTLLEGQYEF